ncbi:NADPH:quinone oxidoreductase family protein [Halorussus gelatinilyticus]|uniref:NADPH:quinone oxidoreductase family protein n=1 Tax=Halorussus gelatinilyticus TaxID=2937524 RepID=A0A8U0IH32_9EURY|nr:NADPH:quinone oxidoreductase family protein [Halorussus gelatinilyticus]UPW00025.1 NADPH:quinone oxidoreductase family protein [Halorussus gelatinilyticus]
MKRVEVTEFGGSDALEVTDAEKPEPGEGEVRIAVEAAGINFADIMQRRGHYVGGPEPTYVPGMEAAGTIDAVGDGVERDEGERVVAMTGQNAYAEYVLADAQSLFAMPEEMSFDEAAGFPVQFMTAHAVLHEWGELEEGERVLVHAAAGGVGTAAVQLASAAGAEVFGTASTDEKLRLAERLGCDHPINYEEEDFRDVVDAETDGEGVDLVLDGVGGETFARSLDALSHFGRVVAYGAASGEPGEVETTRLLFENKSVEGFHLGNALQRDPQRVLEAVPELQQLLAAGELEVVVGERFPLEDAAAAHEAIENRETTGKVVLNP